MKIIFAILLSCTFYTSSTSQELVNVSLIYNLEQGRSSYKYSINIDSNIIWFQKLSNINDSSSYRISNIFWDIENNREYRCNAILDCYIHQSNLFGNSILSVQERKDTIIKGEKCKEYFIATSYLESPSPEYIKWIQKIIVESDDLYPTMDTGSITQAAFENNKIEYLISYVSSKYKIFNPTNLTTQLFVPVYNYVPIKVIRKYTNIIELTSPDEKAFLGITPEDFKMKIELEEIEHIDKSKISDIFNKINVLALEEWYSKYKDLD